MAVFVKTTPPPKPNASAPTTVPTPKRYDVKENGMMTSAVRKANARIAAEFQQHVFDRPSTAAIALNPTAV
jgi:hypothetical protein